MKSNKKASQVRITLNPRFRASLKRHAKVYEIPTGEIRGMFERYMRKNAVKVLEDAIAERAFAEA